MTSVIKVDNIQNSSGTAALSIDSSGRVDINASYVFDQWYLNAHHTTDGDSDITAWSQASGNITGVGKVSGMSVSSGIFTFPQTGLYKVTFQFATRSDASDNMDGIIQVTTDNSTYTTALAVSGGDSGTVNGTATGSIFVNVTDTANVKVKFRATSMDTDSYVIGLSSIICTNVIFERVAPAQ